MPEPPVLGAEDADRLLWYGMAAVRSGLERRPVPGMTVPSSPVLVALGATFVTLEREGRLLGCIGTLEPVRPLYEDVMANAYKSAFADPRLPSVSADDYEAMDVKVSVLGPIEPIDAASRAELVPALRPGRDGVLLLAEGFRATFLPSVWPRVDSAEQFVELLLRKGGRGGGEGNGAGSWLPGMRAFRYETSVYGWSGPRPPVAAAR